MGHFQNCVFPCKNKHLIISLALLLISSFTQKTSMVEGRAIPNSNVAELSFKQGNEEKMRDRSLIGSRPPRCERRCSSCVHCQAVQVPIAPQQKKTQSSVNLSSANLDSRGDDLSNYKPMSWKCKCGSLIFDP